MYKKKTFYETSFATFAKAYVFFGHKCIWFSSTTTKKKDPAIIIHIYFLNKKDVSEKTITRYS